MASSYVSGIEMVEIAPAFFTEAGLSAATWTRLENIAPDTATYTRNADTETELVPEDKDIAEITFYQTGEADQFVIGVLEQKPVIMNMLENNEYTAGTTKTVTLAKRKVARLALRITTRSVKDNRKLITVVPNTNVVMTYTGNYNKNSVQQLLLTAKIGSFKTTTSQKDAISIKTWVTDDGTPIDSTNA
ncbi:MAG: hypothetical protein EOO20_06600 [Chryseobacterium sp.]|uniref:Phage tail protein n=1 Tax=Pedobacter agri TaxID=454586 RepID=A0A9X3DG45_9SPHI|nr:hypothetical protein [Pedobacter agri]MCX3266540.1 hypothetical protein [Pedobacter agri]RZJ90976.1 MAG: hypothetical protein EOO20_06600 [Chryseobacterium sp.]